MADGLDIRRRIEQRLVNEGKDSSPQTINLVAQRLVDTGDRAFVERFLSGEEQIPSWVADAPATGVGGRVLDILQEAALAPTRAAQGIAAVSDWLFGTDQAEGFERFGRHYEEATRSPEMKRGINEISGAEGVGGVLEAMADNPAAAVLIGTESIGPMLAGGTVAAPVRGLAALGRSAPWLARLAPSIGEGLVAGALEEGDAETKAAVAAATMVIGRLGAGVARRLGLTDIDAVVSGKVSPEEIRNILRVGYKVLGSGVVEGLIEEAPQEAVQQAIGNIAEGRPWDEGVAESATIGGVVGFALGSAGAMMEVRRARGERATETPPGRPATEPPPSASTPGEAEPISPSDRGVKPEVAPTEGEPGGGRDPDRPGTEAAGAAPAPAPPRGAP